MSSWPVKQKIIAYVKSIMPPGFNVFDLDSYLKSFTGAQDFIILQFGISEEDIIGFPDRYREEGRVLIHYITEVKTDLTDSSIAVEELRNLLRSTTRIDNIIEILNVGTPRFGTSDSIKIQGSKRGITFYIDYRFNFTKEIQV